MAPAKWTLNVLFSYIWVVRVCKTWKMNFKHAFWLSKSDENVVEPVNWISDFFFLWSESGVNFSELENWVSNMLVSDIEVL